MGRALLGLSSYVYTYRGYASSATPTSHGREGWVSIVVKIIITIIVIIEEL